VKSETIEDGMVKTISLGFKCNKIKKDKVPLSYWNCDWHLKM